MASYLLRNIDDKLWKEVKSICALRGTKGISIRRYLLDCLTALILHEKAKKGKRK